MRVLARALVTTATAVAAAVVVPVVVPVVLPGALPVASAHSGETPLLVEPSSTRAGGTVTVRGDLPVTSDIHLLLVDAAGRMTPLRRVVDPPMGHFSVPVTVPPTTREGAWSIVAVSGGDPVGRVALTVEALPPAAQGRPDQAEPIFAPPPRAAPATSASTAADNSAGQPATAAVVRPPTSTAQQESQPAGTLAVAVVTGVLLAGLAAYAILRPRRRRARPRRRGAGPLRGNGTDQPEGTAARQRARDGASASR